MTLTWSVWRAGVPPEAEASKGWLVSLVRALYSGWENQLSGAIKAAPQSTSYYMATN